MFKIQIGVILLLFSFVTLANSKESPQILEISSLFSKGDYGIVLNKLSNAKSEKIDESSQAYWRGLSFARLDNYEQAEVNLSRAIELKHNAKDLYYEYGQVLYVLDKLKKSRVAFKRSTQNGFKRGTSLYYIGFISQTLKEDRKAVKIYTLIEKLPKSESQDVIQASRMQVADIYLKKVERLPDSQDEIKKYVIPQYKKALEVDKDSPLAKDIEAKIEEIERRYELVLFRMRNGRPTSRPPYYIRGSLAAGENDNILTLSDDAKKLLDKEDYATQFYSASLFGRYSFYPNSIFSYAPEFGMRTTRYLSESSSIKELNSYELSAALKMNYEYIYNNAPATFYLDFSSAYLADYSENGDSFEHIGNNYGMTLSNEMQFFKNAPTTLRFKLGTSQREDELVAFDYRGFSFEQILRVKSTLLYFTTDYQTNIYKDSNSTVLDNSVLFARVDAIFPSLWSLFNPTLYASLSSTDTFEDSSTGVKELSTLGINLNRPVANKLYLTLDMSQSNQKSSTETNNYSQSLITLTLDYIY